MGDCNREVGGQGCGVRRKLDGSGPARGESPPNPKKWGKFPPSPGRAMMLKPPTQSSSRSRMWSLRQLPAGLGTRTISCSVGCPLSIGLGLIMYKRLELSSAMYGFSLVFFI